MSYEQKKSVLKFGTNPVPIVALQTLHPEMLRASIGHDNVPENATKLIFVRHPLPRLVSAYVNKFLEGKRPFLLTIQSFLRQQRNLTLVGILQYFAVFPVIFSWYM